MKKLLLMASLVLAGGAVKAQITLEHLYGSGMSAHKLSTGDVKYVGYFGAASQLRIYNANHSLYRQVPFTLPATSTVGDIQYLSDRLFNGNSNLEMVVNMYNSTNGLAAMRIIDETGATVLAVDSAAYPQVFNSPTGTKMVANIYAQSRSYAKVFALPGTYTSLRAQDAKTSEVGAAYPNPATDNITLPYSLLRGQTGELAVYTVTGSKVVSYTIDSTFEHLLINSSFLNPGVYIYATTVNGVTSTGRRFVVQR